MPCYDPRDSSEGAFEEGLRSAQHNSPVAEMLCSICRKAEKYPAYSAWVFGIEGVTNWWIEHKRRDEVKAKREKEYKESVRRRDEAELKALAKKLGKKVI